MSAQPPPLPPTPPPLPPTPPFRMQFLLALAAKPAGIALAASFAVLLGSGHLISFSEASAGDLMLSLVLGVIFYGGFYAAVVFGLCLFVVAPLLRLLPRSSPLWRPPVAAAIGAAAGWCPVYLLLLLLFQETVLQGLHDGTTISFAGAAALAGAIFAGLYARAVRRNPV